MSGVFLVVTHGRGSMDLYSLRLSQHLRIPTIHTDIYQRVCEVYGLRGVMRVLRNAGEVHKFMKALEGFPGIPHLPNHHLGRFAYMLKKPFIITVHDVIRYLDARGCADSPLIHRPGWLDGLLISLDFLAARKALRIIVPSNFTKLELIRYLGVPESRIRVVYHGVDEVFRPTFGGRPCPEPYILYVGSEHPRKNLETLLRGFKLLKSDPKYRRVKLVKAGVVGGGERDFRAETLKLVDALGLRDDVIFLGWVSQRELASYYTQAEAFVFPSIYEGFGWPPLEAMACGCPVVSSRIPVMLELLGDAAVFVEPKSPEAWRDALELVLESDRVRSRMRARGFERARRFTWARAARETLQVYREVAEVSIRERVAQEIPA